MDPRRLMNYAIFMKEEGQRLIEIVFGIIRTKSFYVNSKVRSDHIVEDWKNGAHFRFSFRKVSKLPKCNHQQRGQTIEYQIY